MHQLGVSPGSILSTLVIFGLQKLGVVIVEGSVDLLVGGQADAPLAVLGTFFNWARLGFLVF